MASLTAYFDEYRWFHELVALQYGVNPSYADLQSRGILRANTVLFATLAKLLVDNTDVTDDDVQEMFQFALLETYEQLPVEPSNTSGIRYNKCPNPALANDASDWLTDGGSGARTAVSGFDRPNVFRVTGSAIVKTPKFTVSPGEVWTASAWVQRAITGSGPVQVAMQWLNSSDVDIFTTLYHDFTMAVSTPTRVNYTATAPTGSVSARMVLIFPYAPGPNDVTMVLSEHTEELLDYFDGDTDGANWDGAQGNSTSTWDTLTPGTASAQVATGAGAAHNGFGGTVFPSAATGTGTANNATGVVS